jgi:hypothetical protein
MPSLLGNGGDYDNELGQTVMLEQLVNRLDVDKCLAGAGFHLDAMVVLFSKVAHRRIKAVSLDNVLLIGNDLFL